jgi:(1->4)-alpha-D-glucan 1-alpha-D-glucosylmutase
MPDIIDELAAQTLQALAARPRPEATYRLQFHAGFTFREAIELTPYLHELGITHCYASPFLKARPGSRHGYDITDHNLLNPEIGSEEDYAVWTQTLQAHGLSQVLDIVPNHMAVTGNENVWWNDVLENGPASPYGVFFDITWDVSPRPELQGVVLVPVLGEPYGKVLESQQLHLNYAAGAFTIHYFEHRFPVAPCSYWLILSRRLDELERLLEPGAPALLEYQSILTAVKNLPPRTETDPARLAERQREKEVIKRRLAALTAESFLVREFIDQTLTLFNGRLGDPASFNLLEALLDAQAYRLAYWRVAADEINYRRFFDVNELAALSMERPEVFQATHQLIFRLLWEGKVTGLRIDHPDGLFDPREYLERLQLQFVLSWARKHYATRSEFQHTAWDELAGPLEAVLRERLRAPQQGSPGQPLFVVVEKILTGSEGLPADWPTYGTTGYEFLNQVNGLFVDPRLAGAFIRLYREWTADDTRLAEVVYQNKRLILQIALSSELLMLSHQLDRLAQRKRWSRDFTTHSLRLALREVIACFPVYRSYIVDVPVSASDQQYVEKAVRRAMRRNPGVSAALFRFVRDMLLLRSPEPADPPYQAELRRFVGKFQQVTSPVMAKGVEDTAFYVYHPLLSLNEVGGDPGHFGNPPAALHRFLQERRQRWPWGLSTTATHDTKRGEDVRARINVLSEMPDEWTEALQRWGRLNQPHRTELEEAPVPDANEEYFIYQTLLGVWPVTVPRSAEKRAPLVQRFQDYLVKALHEAKVHSSWISPDEAYDAAVCQFAARILDPELSADFLADFEAFQKRIHHFGQLNSLGQTLLKIAAPGVPDIYQGTELWDLSLVDPDNRRPVDYETRRRFLLALQERVAKLGQDLRPLARELTAAPDDGRIKLFLLWRGLNCRRAHPGLFTSGEYLPVETAGAAADHVFSFVRHDGGKLALAVVPKLLTKLLPVEQMPCGPAIWKDTLLRLPAEAQGRRWRNVFTGDTISGRSLDELPMAQVCAHFPVALLLAEAE